ncbi:hypothetical protein F4810DRAFT_705318 [Camillea tinctor]|nr:hypothetical protein F4810DRAFT_705318 [Camillea tinctor]
MKFTCSISIAPISILVTHAAIALGMAVSHPPGMLVTKAIGQEGDYTTDVVTANVTVTETTYFTPTPTAFTTTTEIVTETITASVGPPPTTSAPASTFTGYCDYNYCQNGTSICFYWAGYTSWDVSLGPIPGEIPTSIGTC